MSSTFISATVIIVSKIRVRLLTTCHGTFQSYNNGPNFNNRGRGTEMASLPKWGFCVLYISAVTLLIFRGFPKSYSSILLETWNGVGLWSAFAVQRALVMRRRETKQRLLTNFANELGVRTNDRASWASACIVWWLDSKSPRAGDFPFQAAARIACHQVMGSRWHSSD